jgi:hypothetical protein
MGTTCPNGGGNANNILEANGICIPVGASCGPFTVNGCTISADSTVTIQFVLVHNGTFSGGTLTKGTTFL